jgi:hypothetical protein
MSFNPFRVTSGGGGGSGSGDDGLDDGDSSAPPSDRETANTTDQQ